MKSLRPDGAQHNQSTPGFTLVHLMAATSLVAVIAAITCPAYLSLKHRHERLFDARGSVRLTPSKAHPS